LTDVTGITMITEDGARNPEGAGGRVTHSLADARSSVPAGAPAAMTPVVRLEGVTKRYPQVIAVQDVSLDVLPGEFLTLLGPSGSGKTTCLRMIAGFERPTEGRVWLSGRDVTDLPPFDREVNTVFQDYALFPHMTVEQNVGYGLLVRGVGKAERRRRVAEALETVRLPDYGPRRPTQLSGGQRQRVALARALVNRPQVLLLDEPLAALDRKLREQMQLELKSLQREVGITFVLVTHDQDEALTMSDRVVVFDAGRVQQVGPPAEVYERPRNAFVADFIGTSNLVEGEAAARLFGTEGPVSLRPERIRLLPEDGASDGERREGGATGAVADAVHAGARVRYVVVLDAGPVFVVTRSADSDGAVRSWPRRGDRVRLAWRPESVHPLG
jgi:putative spermidine/putrescine transport system ATP-binding protein